MVHKTTLFLLLIICSLVSCTKHYPTPEDNGYFKGVFQNDTIEVKHSNAKGLFFANGTIKYHGDNWFTYGQGAQLEDYVGDNSKLPYLKVEFRNLFKSPGDFQQSKVDSLFPSLFEKGEYFFSTEFLGEETLDEPRVFIEFKDKAGNVWNSEGGIYMDEKGDYYFNAADQSNSYFKVTSSRLVESYGYTDNKHIMEVKGIFSCMLHWEDQSFKVEDVEFQYLYFNHKF